MYLDPEVTTTTKTILSVWFISGLFTPLTVLLAARGSWTWAYIISPNEVALIPFVAVHSLQFIYTVGWARKLGFKPWVYDCAVYLSDEIDEAKLQESIRWWRPKPIKRLSLIAQKSDQPARIMLLAVLLSPSNPTVSLSARLEVRKLNVMAAILAGSCIRISLAVWAVKWLEVFLEALSTSKNYLLFAVAIALIGNGIMAIRAARRRT